MTVCATTAPLFGRFVRELAAQSPRKVDATQVAREGASDAAIEAAWLGWASRIVDEHRSVIVFTELLGILAAHGAPFEALCAVQRLIGDELRHVALCAEMAAAFGPLDALEIDLADLALPRADEPLSRAVAIVARELVVAEGESIVVLRAYRDAAEDPTCRAALSLLLTDEARHHATGRALLPRVLAWAEARGAQVDRAALEGTMREDARTIRAAHRAGAQDGPGRRFGVSIREGEVPSHEAPP